MKNISILIFLQKINVIIKQTFFYMLLVSIVFYRLIFLVLGFMLREFKKGIYSKIIDIIPM